MKYKDVRKEINKLESFSATTDDMPSSKQALDAAKKTSLKREVPVHVEPPKWTPPPEPRKKRKKKTRGKRGSLYTPPDPPTDGDFARAQIQKASELNNTREESAAFAMIRDIDNTLEADEEERK